MSKIKTILRWALFGFAALSAVAFFPSLASLLLVFVAVCALPLPAVVGFLASKLHLTGKVKGFVVLAFFVAAVMLAPTTDPAPDSNDANSPDSNATLQIDTPAPEADNSYSLSDPVDSGGDATAPESDAATPPETNDPPEIPQESDPDAQVEPPDIQEPVNSSNAVVTPPADSSASAAPPSQPEPPIQNANEKTVYVTPSGKRYHYNSTCGNGTYSPTTISQAQAMGLTPCKKCAGG